MRRNIWLLVSVLVLLGSGISYALAAFSDITSSPYKQAIEGLAAKGIVKGYSDGTFRPDATLNRAELLTITERAKKSNTQLSQASCFPDVQKGNWFTPFVCSAFKESIVAGYPDGKFHPLDSVTLAAAAKIAVKTFDVPMASPEFDQAWYVPYMEALSKKGYLTSGMQMPAHILTRGEVAEILWRLLQNYGTEQSDTSTDPLTEARGLVLPAQVVLDVPFTSQAPLKNWDSPYDEACEEASILMVEAYLDQTVLTAAKANTGILEATAWLDRNAYPVDITIPQAKEFVESYYHKHAYTYTGSEVTLENIKRLLATGYPVIVPLAGQLLGNPYYRHPGPPYHMIVITGYTATDFITNDPGTQNGEDYRYTHATILNAIHDWTGSKSTILEGEKFMMVIGKQ